MKSRGSVLTALGGLGAQIQVILRQTVSRPSCPGISLPPEKRDQLFSLLTEIIL
jgi:hypothetical protein